MKDSSESMGVLGIDPYIKWVKSAMCMLMSATKVNLVEVDSFENADIPISFIQNTNFKAMNNDKGAIAFVQFGEMKKTNPKAPLYVNMGTKCAKWKFTNENIYISVPDMNELVHMKHTIKKDVPKSGFSNKDERTLSHLMS